MALNQLTGQTFGAWEVVAAAGTSRRGARLWRCECVHCCDHRVIATERLKHQPPLCCQPCPKVTTRGPRDPHVAMTFEEIGQELGVSKARVIQIYQKAIKKVERALREIAE